MYEILEETQTEQIMAPSADSDAIVLLVNTLPQSGAKSYDINILGASMYNWVSRACPVKPTLVNYNEDDDLLSTIKPMLKNAEYTLVLYSDTPLITSNAVNQILDFVKSKDLSVCKLARGWVFKTEYIKNANTIYALNTYDICSVEQYQVNSTDALIKATNILQARINKYHIANGVNITSPLNTYIECGVAIESGATIEPFAKLQGTTTIGANAKVCSHTTIADSKIDQGAIIKDGSTIIRSAVLDSAIVGNNCLITNKSVVSEEVIVSAGCILDNTTTMKGNNIGLNCTLVNTKLATNVNIGACSKCLGSQAADVKIGGGATIGSNCVVYAGVYIKSDYTLADGKVAVKE